MDIKTAYATMELLAATWPKAFSIAFADRRPLKIGIDKDILAVAEGAITPEELKAALRIYVAHKTYAKRLKEGAQRIDLDGNPAGVVTADQAATARRHIESIERRHSERVRAAGLAKEAAAQKARAEAEAAQRAEEEAKRAAEVAAGKRKPLLRLPPVRRGFGGQAMSMCSCCEANPTETDGKCVPCLKDAAGILPQGRVGKRRPHTPRGVRISTPGWLRPKRTPATGAGAKRAPA